MTKDEIIEQLRKENPFSISTHKSMDRWAEQQCIAFANFIAQHNYKPHDIDTWNEGTKNTHEVYDDFIEFQRIEQQNKP